MNLIPKHMRISSCTFVIDFQLNCIVVREYTPNEIYLDKLLRSSIWSIFVNVLDVFQKNVYFPVWGHIILCKSIKSSLMIPNAFLEE